MKIVICLFALCMIGCSNNSQVEKALYTAKVELADKVFFFGPTLDSVNTEVSAECDCCASNILFKKDSSIIAAFYCLEENSYAKGTFSLINDKLTLTFAPGEVIRMNDMAAKYDSVGHKKTSNFQVTAHPLPTLILSVSSLNAKTVLSTIAEEKEYGMESKEQTRSSFLNALKKDSVLYYLKID